MPKKTIPIVQPPPECAVCTTPGKCGTTELHTKKGPHCVGRANGPDVCDCLNSCGDDPWLKDDRSEPCERYKVTEKAVAADSLWRSLKAFENNWVNV